jgi:pimeloyl-[acyl-carrier protein] methyl ester esterase
MKIALLHGWGMDRTTWDAVIPLLGEFACHADDQGYFGPPEPAGPADLAVTHSLGALRALAAPPPGCRGLVVINGFDCFAQRGDFPEGVPDLTTERMAQRLKDDPQAELTRFRLRIGAPQPPPITAPERLLADLEFLRSSDGRGRWQGPLLLLGGGEDLVVRPPHQSACFADRPDTPRETLPGHGHLLPLTAPEACARAIRSLAASLA